jgi:hypothetical protein
MSGPGGAGGFAAAGVASRDVEDVVLDVRALSCDVAWRQWAAWNLVPYRHESTVGI